MVDRGNKVATLVRNDEHRYGAVAQLFHWVIAGLILFQFGLGWYMEDLPLGPRKFDLYQLHKSMGLTIFGLAVLRLTWRLFSPAPPLPASMPRWEKVAARSSHGLLYGLIFLQPIIGYLQSNAANFPIVLWGVVPIPAILPENEALAETLVVVHSYGAIALAVVVLVHISAALRHHFWLKDDVLRRMLPQATTGR